MSDTFTSICELVKSHSGICVSGAHVEFINSYLRRRTNEMGITLEKYFDIIRKDEKEFRELINETTINETYFFREEKQFAVMRDTILPSFANKQITIWSAACATGEEAVSLALLCADNGSNARIIATDIDSSVLQSFRKGEFFSGSIRSDGSSFSELISKSLVRDGLTVRADKKLISSITIGEYNLLVGGDLGGLLNDESVHIIFLRNVCIYFDMDTRKKIFQRIGKKLVHGGFIFFSMSEIASINPDDFGPGFEKKHEGPVYYIRKKCENDEPCQNRHHQVTSETAAEIRVKTKSVKSGTAEHPKTESSSANKNTNTAAKNIGQIKTPKTAGVSAETSRSSKSAVKTYNAGGSKDSSPVAVYERITAEIDRGRIKNAVETSLSYSGGVSEKHYAAYFKGIAYRAAEDTAESLASFERAAMLLPSFWPAHIQCAQIYTASDPAKARKLFIKSAELIEIYIENRETKYDFLLDSFSAGYFYSMCTAYIDKGADDGNR